MLVRPKKTRPRQLHLFQSRPSTPRWQNLSPEIRRKALTLLARLLRTSVGACQTAEPGGEASDE
jgi:hypothetical protein